MNCQSVFYDPPEIKDFSEIDQNSEGIWRLYAEALGGVWETIWPILAAAERGSLLDVGCGFGFALDFWQRTDRGDAIGVEQSEYGIVGAQKLGLTIYNQPLQSCAQLNARKFDVVYASEVIEHVADPSNFVRLLSGYVAEDGVLILTTPRAEFISKSNYSLTLLAALCPGFHGFLLSYDAFKRMARDAGFTFVEARTFNERQILWASRVPMPLTLDHATLRVALFRFLEERLAAVELQSAVWQGYAYRYLRDLVSTGQNADAQRAAVLLSRAIAQTHGEVVLDPRRLVPKLSTATTSAEVGKIGPYFLPSFYYLLGEIAYRWERDDAKAKLYFDGACAAIEACARTGCMHFLEAISQLWPARTKGAMIDIAAGNYALATATLCRLAEFGDQCLLGDAFAVADASLVEWYVPNATELLASRGIWKEAIALNEAYRSYVRRHYGEGMLTATGIAEALADSKKPMPRDALFPVWFDGMRDVAEAGGHASDSAALQAIIKIGQTFGHHPRKGPRLRDLAVRARRLCGEPLWSSSVSYTLTKGDPH